MSIFYLLLVAKIAVTALLTAIPFLFLPAAKLAKVTGVEGGGTLFRLYGVAITGLLVGYASAFPILAAGQFPYGIAAMGLLSNGGAAAVLIFTGSWRGQRLITGFVLVIAAGLLWSIANPALAIRPLWG